MRFTASRISYGLGILGTAAFAVNPVIGIFILSAASALWVWANRDILSIAHPRLEFLESRKMPLNEVVRRVALNSDWAAQYMPKSDDSWICDVSKEITSKLALGAIDAFGEYCEPPRDMAASQTIIPKEFWRSATIDVRLSILTRDQGSWAYQSGEPPVPIAKSVVIPVAHVDRFWPKKTVIDGEVRRIAQDHLESLRAGFYQMQMARNNA